RPRRTRSRPRAPGVRPRGPDSDEGARGRSPGCRPCETRYTERSSAEMGDDLCYRPYDVLHVRVGHRRKHRKAQQPLVRVLRDLALSALVSEALIVWMPRNGDVVDVDTDVLRPKRAEDLGPFGAQLFKLQLDHVEVPR